MNMTCNTIKEAKRVAKTASTEELKLILQDRNELLDRIILTINEEDLPDNCALWDDVRNLKEITTILDNELDYRELMWECEMSGIEA